MDEGDIFDLIDIKCHTCTEMWRKCSHNHYNENGYYDYKVIPVLYFVHCIAKWEFLYQRLLKFLQLRFIGIDESWPYHLFKKKIRAMLQSK